MRKSVSVNEGLHRKVVELAKDSKVSVAVKYRELFASGKESSDQNSMACYPAGEEPTTPIKIDAEIFAECKELGVKQERSASYVFRQLCNKGIRSLP